MLKQVGFIVNVQSVKYKVKLHLLDYFFTDPVPLLFIVDMIPVHGVVIVLVCRWFWCWEDHLLISVHRRRVQQQIYINSWDWLSRKTHCMSVADSYWCCLKWLVFIGHIVCRRMIYGDICLARYKLAHCLPLSSTWEHLNNDDCLELMGKITRTVLCCIVYDIYAQWYTCMWTVLKCACSFRFWFYAFV